MSALDGCDIRYWTTTNISTLGKHITMSILGLVTAKQKSALKKSMFCKTY